MKHLSNGDGNEQVLTVRIGRRSEDRSGAMPIVDKTKVVKMQRASQTMLKFLFCNNFLHSFLVKFFGMLINTKSTC